MGFALPAAVGVQLAKPDTCVLCVSGDGGFQMNIQELATVHRLGLPIKMVIIDNKYLGMVRQWQQLFYQRNYAETDLSDNPDFVDIAKAYKIHSFRLNEDAMREFPVSSETGDLIDRFLRSPEPELLVFDCAPEANVFPDGPGGRGAFGDVAGRRTDAVQGSKHMQAFHIRYRNTQGTLMRILNAASRRGLDMPSVHAEAARARSPGHAGCSR